MIPIGVRGRIGVVDSNRCNAQIGGTVGTLWVPKTSSGTIDLDFRLHDLMTKDGVWHSPSCTLLSSDSFSYSVSHAMDKRNWPSRS
jgi:hypothetical protein